ncbi:pirin family protein [Paenibacillus sp. GCM10023252]|uniref:pirin family protein n=1 Tax=Paenibacillus sp. GCM10023252 TaxID=3252649 RepID=UPI003618764D
MITIYPAHERYSANHGWLRSNFSFSFADYYDASNMSFGPMRVLNDDWIAQETGFGMHPHREMEIVTLVLSGHLEHQDSLGNVAQTTWGGIQRMSAGTGIMHSEYNRSNDEPLELLQMWFTPNQTGLQPSYETTAFDTDALRNNLTLVVSGAEGDTNHPSVASIAQDMSIYLSEPEAGHSITYSQIAGRKIFLFVLEGSVSIEHTVLNRRDSARIEGEASMTVKAEESSRFMLIDLP